MPNRTTALIALVNAAHAQAEERASIEDWEKDRPSQELCDTERRIAEEAEEGK